MNDVGIAKKFQQPKYYLSQLKDRPYHLLPFNFDRIGEKIFVSNEVGQYLLLNKDEFNAFVTYKLLADSSIYNDLKSKHFLYDEQESVALDLLGLKLRTKYQQIHNFTSLHLFVVTLRCDYSCPYCQVSRQSENKLQYDMSESTALKGLDFVFQSPSPSIKIEFQGGEPLLNFDLIKFIVINAKERNIVEKRDLQFVITTNLSCMNEDVIGFCEEHDIYISTSLDGPEDLHNKNRPRPGKNGYELTQKGISEVKNALGPNKISALMTTTEASLHRVREIIDEYLAQGFYSIFLRPLSPYGFAVKTKEASKYNTAKWLEFYKEGLEYILELNRNGIPFREDYASIIYTKLLTPYNPGYVDLQSPSGAGISAIVFNYDSKVYASDESRMLAEMGDDAFCLGSLKTDTYLDIMGSNTLLSCIEDTITESAPMCYECAYKPYCGSDPVYHYATQKDCLGHKAKSGFCQKNMSLFKYLVTLLERDSDTKQILSSWADA